MVYDKKVLVVFSKGINTYIQQVLLLKEGERRSALSAGIPACSLNKTEKKKIKSYETQEVSQLIALQCTW